MGLDMYLIKKDLVEPDQISNEHVVLYWRKANQIHHWFVTNIQEGVDECGMFEVTFQDLTKLYHCCRSVLRQNERAPYLLPTKEGFFFGSTEYDQYFFYEIKRTKVELRNLLATFDFNKEKLYYTSWW
ncbi:hypothetical protein CR194_05890 [Salipaludibacillus keqinensis]|uniref:Uncharacterized protein n=1 Tax=Salipaludibacillus keqinensis TaxID=2045207 RepID=A0A323TM04_9BACI|nr:hypothetical protein [Salipaludibacillus keqinensis]PYZ95044.1 hypothetical protein CR194_05890 [Salipaludibacillus keqinensis]